jgi:hypothetical protein
MVIAQRDCVELASGKCKLASPLAPKNVSASPKKNAPGKPGALVVELLRTRLTDQAFGPAGNG